MANEPHHWLEQEISEWEARIERATKVLEHLYALQKLRQEEGLDKPAQPSGVSKAEGVQPMGQGAPASVPPPRSLVRLPITPRRPARDRIIELLKSGGSSIPELAGAIGITPQGVTIALAKLEVDGLVVREEATEPGLRYFFRLATDEERAQARDNDAAADAAIEAALD
jgi:predicted Rossmann fold nucleotide-binding protein DprA/Smf involved in DNA uptake